MTDHLDSHSESNADAESSKRRFLYPLGRYYGEFSPGKVAFNANLQDFAQRINFICGLEASGKLPPEEAFQQIKGLWKELKESKHALLDTPMTNGASPEDQA
jgi:hypothetical protein